MGSKHIVETKNRRELFGVLWGGDPNKYGGMRREKPKNGKIVPLNGEIFRLHNRRYIGSKHKLAEWIFSIIREECGGTTFADIFAGTGIIAASAGKYFDNIILNDFLHSNEVIYRAFFGDKKWDAKKVYSLIGGYNALNGGDLDDNYFSANFGEKFFSRNSAKIIGHIREDIEQNKNNITERERDILIASLLYSADKIANTVGHYDAYFKRYNRALPDNFVMKPVEPIRAENAGGTVIYREDANLLAKKIKADVVYIDPPYNSRQYSRFYHILETLTKWDNPHLYGVALKPKPENMSDYCRVNARAKFAELVKSISAGYIAVSYNNTYEPKSKSSENKIAIKDIEAALKGRGKTKKFEKKYRHFNAGNTYFADHKEYLFITKVEK